MRFIVQQVTPIPQGQKVRAACVIRNSLGCLCSVPSTRETDTVSHGTAQPISIRQQLQWGGMCSALHQTEGWSSAEAPLKPTNFLSFTPIIKYTLFWQALYKDMS